MTNKRRRRMFSATESAEVWDRWQPHGGIRPVPRRRSRRVLSLGDREEFSRWIASGVSLRSIAAELQRAPWTISRELRRNGDHGRSGRPPD